MKCTICLPYNDYNESNFDVNDNYYSNGGYEKALKANNDMYGDSIYNHISGGFNANTSVYRDPYAFNRGINGFNEKVSENEEKMAYSSCEGFIYNEYMVDETIDGLKSYSSINDGFILVLKLDFNTTEEEFETELKMWYSSHIKINNVNADDEWKFENEPVRTLKIESGSFSAYLINSKLLEISNDTFVILVEKIKYSL
jgi:hypothetical protein